MKIIPSNRTAGFTLVEMLAVITIIVILASLVVVGLGFATDKQARETARVQIALLGATLEEYKLDNGIYPPVGDNASGENNSTVLFDRLFWDSDDDGITGDQDRDQKVYLSELDPMDSKQKWTEKHGNSYKIVDPWGNEYRYRSAQNEQGSRNSSTQNPDFDLWSVGKDGLTNTSQPFDPEHEDNRDDIRNF